MLSVNGNVSFSLCRPLAFSVSVVKDEFNLEVQQYIVCRFAPEGRDVYRLPFNILSEAQ